MVVVPLGTLKRANSPGTNLVYSTCICASIKPGDIYFLVAWISSGAVGKKFQGVIAAI